MVLARRNYDLGEFAVARADRPRAGLGPAVGSARGRPALVPAVQVVLARASSCPSSEARRRARASGRGPSSTRCSRALTHVHTIPGDPAIRKTLAGIRPGQVIRFKATLVDAQGPVRLPLCELARARRSQLRDRLGRRARARVSAVRRSRPRRLALEPLAADQAREAYRVVRRRGAVPLHARRAARRRARAARPFRAARRGQRTRRRALAQLARVAGATTARSSAGTRRRSPCPPRRSRG